MKIFILFILFFIKINSFDLFIDKCSSKYGVYGVNKIKEHITGDVFDDANYDDYQIYDINYKNANNWTCLMSASRNNNIELAQYLILAGTNINVQGVSQDYMIGSALYQAVLNNHTDMALYLLSMGSDSNETITGYYWRTDPLNIIEVAIKNDNIKLIVALTGLDTKSRGLTDQFIKFAQNDFLNTIITDYLIYNNISNVTKSLHELILHRNYKHYDDCIRKNNYLKNTGNETGNETEDCWNNYIDYCLYGCINRQIFYIIDRYNVTCLSPISAIETNNLELLKYIYTHSFNPEHWTPNEKYFSLAIPINGKLNMEFIHYLYDILKNNIQNISLYDRMGIVSQACCSGNITEIDYFINYFNISVNNYEILTKNTIFSDNTTMTMNFKSSYPIISAVRCDNLEVVKHLHETHGANINVTSDSLNDNTPLLCACSNLRHDILEYILNIGGDLNERNRDNQTCIDIAKYWERQNIIDYLVA